jgi:hypothetical protein
MDSIDQTGEWWVPGGRYASVQGSLQFSPSNVAQIDFSEPLSHPSDWSRRIFGIADGEKYTLCDCQTLPSNVGLSNKPRRALPQTILIGAHILPKHKYHKVRVDFSKLEQWACDKLYERREMNGTVVYEFDTSTTTLAEIEHDDNLLSLKSEVTITRSPCEKVEKRNKTFFLIESDPNPFDHYNEYILELQRLVSLGLNDPVHPREVFAWSSDGPGSTSIKVKVLHNLSHYHQEGPSISHSHFTSVDTDLEPVLQRWFDDLEGGKILRNLYFGAIYNDDMFEENRLLSLVSAIESYHDQVMFPDDTTIPDSEFKDIKNDIQGIVSGTGLEGRMNGLIKNVINDISIKDKLIKFMCNQEQIYESLSEDSDYDHEEVIDEVAKKAAGARHSVAHGSDELDRTIIGIGGVTDWLQLGIEACLLSLVEIEQDQIIKQLRINYHVKLDKVSPPPFDEP